MDAYFLQIAVDEALKGLKAGGIPIGACLVLEEEEGRREGEEEGEKKKKKYKILGQGHNKRVQEGSVIKHGDDNSLFTFSFSIYFFSLSLTLSL